MKQKEGAPFYRCLVDRSLHHPPNTKASKTYSQRSFGFHIRDDGTLDGACMFGSLSCAPRLHFAQQSISLWLQSICSSSFRWALQGCGCRASPATSLLPSRGPGGGIPGLMALTCPQLGTGHL